MRNHLGKNRNVAQVPFGDGTVEVLALSVGQIREFQKFARSAKASESEDDALAVQRQLIRLAVVGANDLTDEELDSFTLKELADLAKAILEHNGLRTDEVDVGNEG